MYPARGLLIRFTDEQPLGVAPLGQNVDQFLLSGACRPENQTHPGYILRFRRVREYERRIY